MNTLTKYVVTDPCYILNDDGWDECCKFLDNSPKAFNEAVSKALTDLTGFSAYACGVIKFMAVILSIKNFALIPAWFAFVG